MRSTTPAGRQPGAWGALAFIGAALPGLSGVRVRRSAQLYACARTAPRQSEDDDATIGSFTMDAGFGAVSLPPMSPEDHAYLDGALSHDDFMLRVSRIAKKMDAMRVKRPSADDYMDSLKRVRPAEGAGGVEHEVVLKGDDANNQFLAGLSRNSARDSPGEMSRPNGMRERIPSDSYMDKLTAASSTGVKSDAFAPDHPVAKDVGAEEEEEEKIAALEAELRELASEEKVEVVRNASGSAPADKPEVVDKQIQYLEGYLERLKREAEAEDDTSSSTGEEDVRSEDVSGTFRETMQKLESHVDGTMSAEEKEAAFAAIRRQAQTRGSTPTAFADPLATPLPMSSGDVPLEAYNSEESAITLEGADRVRMVILEAQEEMQRHLSQSRQALDEHELRMRSIMDRLLGSL